MSAAYRHWCPFGVRVFLDVDDLHDITRLVPHGYLRPTSSSSAAAAACSRATACVKLRSAIERQAAMLARMQELKGRGNLRGGSRRSKTTETLGRAVGSHDRVVPPLMTSSRRRRQECTTAAKRPRRTAAVGGFGESDGGEVLRRIANAGRSPAGLTLPGLPTMPDVSVNLSQTTQAVSFALGNWCSLASTSQGTSPRPSCRPSSRALRTSRAAAWTGSWSEHSGDGPQPRAPLHTRGAGGGVDLKGVKLLLPRAIR